LERFGEGTGSARILDLLLPRCHFGEAARHLARGTPEIDLENERVRRPLRHDPLKRRIRHQAAIPVVLAFDLDRGKARRQRATCHYMLWRDPLTLRVEID